VRGRRVSGVRRRFRFIELRLVRDVRQRPCLCAGSEERALRTFQYLDTLEIGGVDIKVAARKLRGSRRLAVTITSGNRSPALDGEGPGAVTSRMRRLCSVRYSNRSPVP